VPKHREIWGGGASLIPREAEDGRGGKKRGNTGKASKARRVKGHLLQKGTGKSAGRSQRGRREAARQTYIGKNSLNQCSKTCFRKRKDDT